MPETDVGPNAQRGSILVAEDEVDMLLGLRKSFIRRGYAGVAREAVEHNLEMLVRAYDPCISCSTHMLNVEFV